ncbi:MAG TPA: DUF1553 domain-containing protein [Bryobacteraceae bacterium]|nr:DUF1553 domain-containing protein [Bryobacteraceae bacterium]
MKNRFGLAMLMAGMALAAQQKPVDFQREIRPILSNACYHCHGPDKGTRMANLRLDLAGPALVPGKPEESKLWKRINHANAALRMPPPQAHKTLTDAQKDLLRRWIEQGAVYKEHWSFAAPKRSGLPAVKDTKWVRTPLDQFLLARLEADGLTPAPEADRRTLARRLSLDITGLPPAPDEVEAFVRDTAPDAYENLVDRLLAKPQYGEHRARFWLDAARYADTHGLHVDNYREMWPYRDWVIAAYNKNMPFDQFTIEQLAGDLLPNPTMEQLVATGFHRCNITTNEGGSIEDEVAAIYAKDRVDTTGAVWMGLTVGCATCHDHKFDPITQKEFYQMAAFFRNTTQKPMDGNIHDTPPVIAVPAENERARWNELLVEEKARRAARDAHRKSSHDAFLSWVEAGKYKSIKAPFRDSSPRFSLQAPGRLPEGVTSVPGSVAGTQALSFTGKGVLELPAAKAELDSRKPFTVAAWVLLPKEDTTFTVASKLHWPDKKENVSQGWVFDFESRRPRFQLLGGKEDDLILIRAGQMHRLQPATWHHVAVTFDGSRDYKGLSIYIDGKIALTETNPNNGGGKVTGSTLVKDPLRIGGDGNKRFFNTGAVQEFQILDRPLRDDEVEALAGWLPLKTALAGGTAPQDRALDTLEVIYLNRTDKEWQKLSSQWLQSLGEQRSIARRAPVTHVMNEVRDKDPEAFVLFRGMYDQPRDKVRPEVPAVAGQLGDKYPRNRMGLARWLVAPENPLTSRVTVNRLWQEIFGNGIVRSAEDFGAQGTPPSHPELLDWLAVEFRESGWDTKRLIRMMVTSAAYRQSAVSTDDKRRKDPENLLLSRGPRFRMDGEMVRDYALAVSGLLVPKIGGPSVRPYQPEGIWETVAMNGSNTRFYKQDHGDALYRRTMYTFWKRSAPPASMEIFNAPTRENCTVRRERTNTPLQALITMNDVQFVEAARQLAERSMKSVKQGFDGRVDYMAARALSRSLEDRERAVLQRSYKSFLSHYDAKPDEAKKLLATGESSHDSKLSAQELAAWTMVASQILNLDEALNK